MRSKSKVLLATLLLMLVLPACGNQAESSVVVYTSVDQVFAEPILQRFAQESGVKVLPVYDIEAAKTTGLVNRLIAEADNPQADVFWSGEFAQTILLKERGVLQPYRSPHAVDIPKVYRDPQGYWTGFGGRARVLIINTELVPPDKYPTSIFDLLAPSWQGPEIGIAYPLFGTTATHAAALYAALGPQEGHAYFDALQARGVRVVDGNSVVRDLVANGDLALGLTDTDDACSAIKKGAPVTAIFPDQESDALGTLVIPNTVALIAGAPHPEAGQALIDFLLHTETETAMIASGWSHVPLRSTAAQPECFQNIEIKGMGVGLEAVYNQILTVKNELAEVFVR